MSHRPTPETDAEWDRLQMLPGGGYSSKLAGPKLAFGMANWAASLERQRDEARELARDLRNALELKMVDHRPYGSAQLARARKATQLIEKAKEVLP
jgi:hypothetical protein